MKEQLCSAWCMACSLSEITKAPGILLPLKIPVQKCWDLLPFTSLHAAGVSGKALSRNKWPGFSQFYKSLELLNIANL